MRFQVTIWNLQNRNFFIQTIVLWGCRHVTENGLLALVNKCCELKSINVWGMRVPLDCFVGLLTISPALQIQPKGMLLNDERFHAWPVYWGATIFYIELQVASFSNLFIGGKMSKLVCPGWLILSVLIDSRK